jgi:drug/metabolite transporter (DMT)-like permease
LHRMSRPARLTGPAVTGGLLALLAAALFGVSTPLVQLAGRGLGPFWTAALLYAGAAMAGALMRKPAGEEARLRASDARWLLGVAFFGALLGPVALAWGLQRASGAGASLMLAMEALFTVALARALYGETLDRRVWRAMLALLAGGVLLVLDQARSGREPALGLLAVLVATASWGTDNALSRALADRDPGQVVMCKAALGAACAVALAFAFGEHLPSAAAALALALIGAAGYGLSLRFYLLAQRAFGAARTGSVFACAPFIGALAALALGDRSGSYLMLAAGALMAAGVWAHLSERHEHEHEHAAVEHEHAHTHDDGHHSHTHEPVPTGPHSHPHRHEPVRHAHPHTPDLHHQHRH